MEDIFLQVLPDLSQLVKAELMTVLTDIVGVNELHHLPLVKETDLTDVIKPIQARMLIEDWKRYSLPPPSPACTEPITDSESDLNDLDSSISSDSSNWTQNFQIPWYKCHPELIKACEKGIMPSERHRREMIRVFADAIQRTVKRPKLKDIEWVARDIIRKYPASFEDRIEGTSMGSGCGTVTRWLFNRVNNINRKPVSLDRDMVGPPIESTRRKSVDEYGCVCWSPQMTASDKKEMEDKQEWLSREFLKTDRNHQQIHLYMKECYALQRSFINNNTATSTLHQKWPFLFEVGHMFDHYGKLVGKENVKNSFVSKISEGSMKIYKALEHSAKSEIAHCVGAAINECKMSGSEASKSCACIDLMCGFFDEQSSGLYHCVKDQLDINHEMPSSPYIVVIGKTIASATKFLIYVEKKEVVCIFDFHEALAYTFCCFYVLNMKYPDGNVSTLEFIQRFFAEINEVKTKTGKRFRGISGNPKVLRLARHIETCCA